MRALIFLPNIDQKLRKCVEIRAFPANKPASCAIFTTRERPTVPNRPSLDFGATNQHGLPIFGVHVQGIGRDEFPDRNAISSFFADT
jgi:hypothetical protein